MATMFAPIEEPYLHGVYATRDNRKVEVVREYASQWAVFCYVDGTMQRGENVSYPTAAHARKVARIWLEA
jgi:hypothetical protein